MLIKNIPHLKKKALFLFVSVSQFTVCIRKNNQTIYQQVLSSRKPKNKHLSSAWNWGFPGSQAAYTGLYPRAWTVYEIPEHQIKLVCRQITPIIPGDYKVGLRTAVYLFCEKKEVL